MGGTIAGPESNGLGDHSSAPVGAGHGGPDPFLAALAYFWHPVCTVTELRSTQGGRGPLPVTLLGQKLVVSEFEGGLAVLAARCPHRSASLACGQVEPSGVRCGYHGWRFGADGRCDDIPAMPDGPIPGRAAVAAFEAAEAYGLVWVRLDDRASTEIPACPAWGDPSYHLISGDPYTWPVAAPRRVENFVDLAHFAFVHDGSLGRRDDPVPPLPEIQRAGGELHFVYEPPDLAVDPNAMYGRSVYRMPMPLTVSIEFTLATGARRVLWMTASPVDAVSCRAFWLHGRDDDLLADDTPYIEFQDRILAEDEPVVCSQDPPWMPLDAGIEVSIRTDKVSIEYRRWLRELLEAARNGIDPGAAVAEALASARAVGPDLTLAPSRHR